MIAWAAEAMAASALLMALVLLARAPVRRAFGAEAACWIWALPALRLLLPPLPAWHQATAASLVIVGERATVLILPAAPAPADESLLVLLIAAWLIGAALLFAWQAAAYARFRRRVLAGAVPLARIGRVRIIASAAAPGPVAFGVLRPAVAVPLGWEARFDVEARELAIAHELAHPRAAIYWPTRRRLRCLRCTGSTRSHGARIARSAAIRSRRPTRACSPPPPRRRAPMPAASSPPRPDGRCRPPATSPRWPTSRGD